MLHANGSQVHGSVPELSGTDAIVAGAGVPYGHHRARGRLSAVPVVVSRGYGVSDYR